MFDWVKRKKYAVVDVKIKEGKPDADVAWFEDFLLAQEVYEKTTQDKNAIKVALLEIKRVFENPKAWDSIK